MIALLFKLLNMITAWEVEGVGGLLYLAAVAFRFRNKTGLVLLALLTIYVLSRLTKAFGLLAKTGFWDADSIHTWPAFVALGIACIIATLHPHGWMIAASVFTILDGMYFEQNY